MAITEASVTRRPDFAEVYREQLAPVWRYVRSRVPEHHEAQDVTAEVFARAWRSWGRYDVARGEVGAWLFRIAHRTVVDWIRHRSRGRRLGGQETAPAADPRPTPEEALLGKEELDLLGRAMNSLTERERDALALRFAGDLRVAEIADVLGLSTPAAKVMIWRAIAKLRAVLLGEERVPEAAGGPVELERVLDTVMGRVRGADPALDGIVAMLSSAYRHEVPPKLPDRIAACTGCAHRLEKARGTPLQVEPGKRARMAAWHLGLVPFMGFGWALLVPTCLACVISSVWPSIAGGVGFLEGLFGHFRFLGYDPLLIHGITLAVQPLVLIPLWLNYRRHRRPAPLILGLLGTGAILTHLALHLSYGLFGFWFDVWRLSVKVGAALIIAAVVLNIIDMTLWVARQKRQLTLAVVESGTPPRFPG